MKNTKGDEKIGFKNIESMMRLAFLYRADHNYREYYFALIFTCVYWVLWDHLTNDNKADIFNYLYLTSKNFSNTYIKSSMELCVSLRTLERYRKKFVLSFQLILTFIQKHKLLKVLA